MNYSLIPNIKDIDRALYIADKYSMSFEYNEFSKPEIYTDEKEISRVIDFYKALNRDRSGDTMHGTFLGVDIAAIDPVIRDRSRELCKLSADIAEDLTLKGVVYHTGLLGLLRVSYYIENWVDTAEEFFGSLCEKHKKTCFYLENSFEQEPDVFIKLMGRLGKYDNFKLCLDYGHAVLTPTPIETWVDAFLPYIGHMHLNDNDLRDDLHLAVGSGNIDFEKYKQLLESKNINTSVLLEMNDYDNVLASIDYLCGIGLM